MGEGLLTAAPLRTLGQETFANREAANTSVGQGLLTAAPLRTLGQETFANRERADRPKVKADG